MTVIAKSNCERTIFEFHAIKADLLSEYALYGPGTTKFFLAARNLSKFLDENKYWRRDESNDLSDILLEAEKIRELVMGVIPSLTTPFQRGYSWLRFPSLKEELMEQGDAALPVNLADCEFSIADIHKEASVTWNGMATCACPRKSAASVDCLMQNLAATLEKVDKCSIISFGSGGCLDLVPLFTRLECKKATLILIDPAYDEDLLGNFKIARGSVSEIPDSAGRDLKSAGLLKFIEFCSRTIPERMTINFQVLRSEANVNEKSKSLGSKPYLLSVDPVPLPSYIRDFRKLAKRLCMHKKKTEIYILNEAFNSKPFSPLKIEEICSQANLFR